MNATTNYYVLNRVSTSGQNFDGQNEIIDAYLEKEGFTFRVSDLKVYSEKIGGAAKLEDRIVLDMIDEVPEGSTIFIGLSSRLSRCCISGMWILLQAQRKNITFFDCMKGSAISIETMNDKLTTFIEFWSNNSDLEKITVASRAGTRKAKKDGTVKYGRANEKYSIDSKTKSEAYIKSSQTRVLSRLNNPMLRTIISAMEVVIPEIKEYALIGSKYPFLGYQKYGRITAEQWDRIHDAYGRICGNSPQINKDATIKDLQYLYYYLWKTHFMNAAKPFVSYV